jgi:hypothetical protein
MSGLWSNAGHGWDLLQPQVFDAEKSLHDLVEEAPQLLPLSGSPRLVIVGREVGVGGGSADLLAVDSDGRLVVVEIKLAKNAEARRAVVAQILAYAAFLQTLDVEALERDVLGRHLRERGFGSLAEAAASVDQERAFDERAFADGLDTSLASGAFRLVLVLDTAPTELVRLVGYLEQMVSDLVIDLITVSAYEVGGSRILVPQRIDPKRPPMEPRARPRPPTDSGYLADGADDFIESIDAAPEDQRSDLRRLADWAGGLEAEGLVRLKTYHGRGRLTLLPRLVGEDVGLATIWNDNGAYLSLWRSVFERRAPSSIAPVESLIGDSLGTGKTVRGCSDELLEALTLACREANTR